VLWTCPHNQTAGRHGKYTHGVPLAIFLSTLTMATRPPRCLKLQYASPLPLARGPRLSSTRSAGALETATTRKTRFQPLWFSRKGAKSRRTHRSGSTKDAPRRQRHDHARGSPTLLETARRSKSARLPEVHSAYNYKTHKLDDMISKMEHTTILYDSE